MFHADGNFVQEKLERLEEGILGDLGRQVIASTKMKILFSFGQFLAKKNYWDIKP